MELDAENKLLILYLLNKMELPMSHGQITEFIIRMEFMEYYTLQEALWEMTEKGWLESASENSEDQSTTLFFLTPDGEIILELLQEKLTQRIKGHINKYVHENYKEHKRRYENTASYFPDLENDNFIVKCAIYEDKRPIIELSISVDTREQAKLIQANWKSDASVLYGKIIDVLTD